MIESEDEKRRREFLLGTRPISVDAVIGKPTGEDIFLAFPTGAARPTCFPGKEHVAGSGVWPMGSGDLGYCSGTYSPTVIKRLGPDNMFELGRYPPYHRFSEPEKGKN